MSDIRVLVRGRTLAVWCRACSRHVRVFEHGASLTVAQLEQIEGSHVVAHGDFASRYDRLYDGLYDDEDGTG